MTIMWGATLGARLLLAFVLPVRNHPKALCLMGAACTLLYAALIPVTDTVPAVIVLFLFSAAIAGVNLTMGGKTMSFSNLGLGGGQSLVIDHEDTGKIYYLRARIGNTSVLRRRTGADDFVMAPGSNKIAFAASRAVRVTVAVRGRYL